MSIVNDALKKASKEFEFKDQSKVFPILETAPGSDKRWIAIITASLVIIASIFGSMILYKNLSNINASEVSVASANPATVIQSTLNNIERIAPARQIKSQEIAKLDGIVCGDECKWAIVNDRIVKEGDKFLDGEITSITKDLVKIGKKDGSEVVLSLK